MSAQMFVNLSVDGLQTVGKKAELSFAQHAEATINFDLSTAEGKEKFTQVLENLGRSVSSDGFFTAIRINMEPAYPVNIVARPADDRFHFTFSDIRIAPVARTSANRAKYPSDMLREVVTYVISCLFSEPPAPKLTEAEKKELADKVANIKKSYADQQKALKEQHKKDLAALKASLAHK